MSDTTKQQSNPFSTGGGGSNFETRVQAAFAVLMLTGRVSPCLPNYSIYKLMLQGKYAGYNTDDFIVFSKQLNTQNEARLLVQIKHEISISESNGTFAEVINGAWSDFNGKNFNRDVDSIALITGPLSANDINNVRTILEWARYSENETDFLVKINTTNFSSAAKKTKLEAFKKHLKTANNGADITDKQLWEFLKVFHLLGFDLDTESGGAFSLILSLISLYSNKDASLLWSRVIEVVQSANQNAGTLTLETLPDDIQKAFNTIDSSNGSSELIKLHTHGRYILDEIKTTVGGIHINMPESVSLLLDLTESFNFVVISGERGCGKSSLVRVFADYISNKYPTYCLRTEDLDIAHLDNVFSAMGIQTSLLDLEARLTLIPKKYLILESLEKLLELKNTSAFIDLLQFLKKQQGWTIIATCRDYAYQTITFNFLQPVGINYETIILNGFNDDQIISICEQSKDMKKFADNITLRPLLKSPFIADLAYRVIESGAKFTETDGEKEFRSAVWRDVIAREQVRTNGMPYRRKDTFIEIAVKRAKQMVYGIPLSGFDNEAILKLEEDNLIRHDSEKDLVSPAHDVLEDWALEKFIEKSYQRNLNNAQKFFTEIGNEPAINRGFRLWLHQKLRLDENIKDFVSFIIKSKNIEKYWQDETIAAILLGDSTDEFLEIFKDQLFLEEGKLLKRFCTILRNACQTPDAKMIQNSEKEYSAKLSYLLFLKPYGKGWDCIISFLYRNRNILPKNLIPHTVSLLNDWSTVLHLDELYLSPMREAGLLALYLLTDFKEEYRNDGNRKKILSIIIKTIPAIQGEFINLLDTDVFVVEKGKGHHRPHYVDHFCEILLSGFESIPFCKFMPDALIKLAYHEWYYQPPFVEDAPLYGGRMVEPFECFGLHEHRHGYFPASGEKGPFKNLLYFHPAKGLNFIIDLLNTTAEKYAHSDLDSIRESSCLAIGYPESLVEQVEIQLNDGSIVRQYCSSRLWLAYRGQSVVPYLLQCALMNLENWLIAYVENCDPNKIQDVFDFILRNSNSVMPTAILASVATGFHEKVGKAALPLLRTADLYIIDMERAFKEMGGNEINWFHQERDPFAKIYAEERRTAALRPWRKDHLETLAARLQFSIWKVDTLAAIDTAKSKALDNERMKFLFHRIDSRGWKVIEDKENNRIIFQAKGLEPELEEVQRESQEKMRLNNRFITLNMWAKGTYEQKPLENTYYPTWNEALVEAKELFEKLKTGALNDLAPMYNGGIVTAASVFIRDHSKELTECDISWCTNIIISAIIANADTNNSLAIADVTDHDGAAAAASVIPIFLDFVSDEEEKMLVKNIIVIAFTHMNEVVRCKAASGIREHLWSRDPDFAQNCFLGAIEYSRFEQNHLLKRSIPFLIKNADMLEEDKRQAEKDKFRDNIVKGAFPNNIYNITFQTCSSWHLLTPCFMIPDGSSRHEHISFFTQMLSLFYSVEENRNKGRSERNRDLEVHYEIRLGFIERFAHYIFDMHESGFGPYIDQLQCGCDNAPDFMNSFVIYFEAEAEKKRKNEVYWILWEKLSTKLQIMAKEFGKSKSDEELKENKRKLIKSILHADINWQKIDYERKDIALGKDLILEFIKNAGLNPDVFEALASLMYHFPSIFFDEGILVLSKHQKEIGGITLFANTNTAFYLEMSIQRFLLLKETGPLCANIHDACLVLLSAIVETASARAYYLREHLIKSRRII